MYEALPIVLNKMTSGVHTGNWIDSESMRVIVQVRTRLQQRYNDGSMIKRAMNCPTF